MSIRAGDDERFPRNVSMSTQVAVPRPPRLQYENAIYHIVTRGDGRRSLFHDQGHYKRFTDGLVAQVDRCGWQIIAYCWMPNHIHTLLRTPQPSLARGMQHWLRGYAKEALVRPVESTIYRIKDRVYVGEEFLRQMIQWANQKDGSQDVRQSLCKSQHRIDAVISATAQEYGVDPGEYVGFRSGAAGRDVAANLCRRDTTATLAELSATFGLSHRDSSGDLVKRARRRMDNDKAIERRMLKIEKRLCLKSESRI
jgi:REP element-mobilizing transposase RayT